MLNISHECHRYDELIVAFIMSEQFPLGMTGSIWQKSPPNTITLPPKIWWEFGFFLTMSLKLWSSASKQNLWAIGASSQIIRLVWFSNSANWLPWCMLHVESSKIGIRILNLECAVLPPGNNREVMPLEASHNNYKKHATSIVVENLNNSVVNWCLFIYNFE